MMNSSITSGIYPQCFEIALVTPAIKKKYLDHNYLYNYDLIDHCFFANIKEQLVPSKFSSCFNSHNHFASQSAYLNGDITEAVQMTVFHGLFLFPLSGKISVQVLPYFFSTFDII